MSIGSKIANYFHVTAVLGSAGLFGYLSWCLGYNFYLNWNTQVKLSDDNIKQIGLGQKHQIDQRRLNEIKESALEQKKAE